MRLHHPAFPQHVLFSCRTLQRFSLEQQLYTSEGINWSHITWQDTWSTDDTVRHHFTYSFERNSLDTMFVKHLRPPEFLEIPGKELKNLQAFLFSMLQTSSNYTWLLWSTPMISTRLTYPTDWILHRTLIPDSHPVHCWDHFGEQKASGFLWYKYINQRWVKVMLGRHCWFDTRFILLQTVCVGQLSCTGFCFLFCVIGTGKLCRERRGVDSCHFRHWDDIS